MANRFWVGTGNWSDTAHWSTTTGGAGGASVPGTADAAILDAASGGGVCTVDVDISCQSVTMGAFTGTFDNSVNNKNVTVSATTAFSITGTGVRNIKLGNGTYFLTGPGSTWDATVTTNLTFDPGNSLISWTHTAPTATRAFNTGGLTYKNFYIAGITTRGNVFQFVQANAAFPGNFTVDAPNNLLLVNGSTMTIGNLLVNGTVDDPVSLLSTSVTASATIAVTTATITGAVLRWMAFTGGPTATDSSDLGGNSGVSIIAPLPAAGGASAGLPASRAYLGVN
jgi:hypothetical protein